ncbi:MAG TPA: histidine phosphatase family protein [Anaerolineales bacterium]|jgi:broad specificity phosphatase PhoE
MLILVRHGETELNASKRLQGLAMVQLTLKGIRQARLIAEYLEDRNITCIYTSNLPRAIQTAEIITDVLKIDPIISPNLRERHYGIFDGIKQNELLKIRESRGLFKADPTQQWDDFPDVESDDSIWKRFLNWLVENNIDDRIKVENIIAVTHAGVLKSVLYKMLSIPSTQPYAFRISNGSAIFLRKIEGFWSMTELWQNHENL